MANRGPDAESIRSSPRAVLGHRRLSVIDLDGGAQPMASEGPNPVVLVHNGEVYNYRSLRSELVGRGHRFTTDSDTEVVLRSYLEWGKECVHRLEGMFAFAVWDPREQQLVLVRDHLGIKPLFYFPTPSGALFGSEPKALLAHPAVEPTVDAEGLTELLGFCGTPGHAVYRGMREVRPGHLVTVSRTGVRETEYWSLPARPHTDDWDTTVSTVRELLGNAVEEQLVADVPLCTLLSGGIDSSTLVALAARATDRSPRTFSVDFAGHEDRFAADDWHKAPDAPFALQVAEHLGSDHEPVVLHTDDLIDPIARSVALRCQDLPRPLGDMDRSLYLLLRAVRESSTVALCGEVADEVFGGYSWYHDPTLVDAGTFPWVALAQRYAAPHGLGTGLLDRDLLASLDVPGYCRDRYAEAMTAAPALPGEDGLERTMRAVGYTHLTRWMPMLLTRDDRLSMASGLELRVPYCDRRLVEYVFNIPWAMKTADGREKSVLRAAAEGLLPRSVLDRAKSPFPTTQDPGYGAALRKEFLTVVSDPNSPVAPLLDRRETDELLSLGDEIPVDGWKHRNNVDLVLQLNAWLREYGVRLAL